ncbi:MAG TPA: hypothetical protein DCQ32_08605 [Cyanobacteria bacterium UBA8156]|jgi:polyphosphate kinase 2 (PPK2 family)|nr:hypothetical protein [Cyanobacteria bacterium UBA8156]
MSRLAVRDEIEGKDAEGKDGTQAKATTSSRMKAGLTKVQSIEKPTVRCLYQQFVAIMVKNIHKIGDLG